MRSVFCANIAKIDQSGFHVEKKCISIFIFEGFSDLKIILDFFFFRHQPIPFGYEHSSIPLVSTRSTLVDFSDAAGVYPSGWYTV